MKKILSAILTMSVVFASINITAANESGAANNNNDIVISGSGAEICSVNLLSADLNVSNDLWKYTVNSDGIYIYKYLGTDENVTIPSYIDGLPVVQIGADFTGSKIVFENIPIKTVTLPDTVKRIYDYAFENSTSLTDVILSDNLSEIGFMAFAGCISLSNITIPGSVSKYDSYVFSECTSLTNVTINSGIDISDGMFNGCTSLTNITFNKSVSSIGSESFKNCTALRSIELKEGLTSIGSSAFENSGLRSINTPQTLKTVYSYAFYNCSSLTQAALNDGITKMYEGVFKNCTSLSKVNIPNSLTAINSEMFYNCTSIKEIVIGKEVTVIGESAFEECASLVNLTLNEGLTIIRGSAFCGCKSLKDIKLPSTLIEIQNYDAFRNCTSLSNVELNEGLTYIGNGAFENCAIKSIEIPSTVKTLGGAAFYNCVYLTDVKLNDEITKINSQTFYNCTVLNNINIPDTISAIEREAFRNCLSLKSITMGENLLSIGSSAFRGCTELYDINLNEGLTSIYDYAFADISAQSIVIPSTVNQIGNSAFYHSDVTRAIFSGAQPNSFGSDVFYKYSNQPETIIYYRDKNKWTEGTYNGYKCYPYPDVNEIITISDCDRTGFVIDIEGTDIVYPYADVSVWSNANGQDDVEIFQTEVNYDPINHKSYLPSINVSTANHNNETGSYTVSFSYRTKNNSTEVVKTQTVNVPAVSNKVEIEIPDVSVTTDGTVRVPVKITNNVGFSTFGFILNYDSSVITPLSVENGSIWTGNFAANPSYSTGQISINGMDIKNANATGDFCYVSFKVNEGVSQNLKTELSMTVNELYKYDEDYNTIEVKSITENGIVNIQHIVMGDVNFDGKITSLDATQALLHASDIKTLTGTAFTAADINGDGWVTSADATLILLAATGLKNL